jgi:hypothetical protein
LAVNRSTGNRQRLAAVWKYLPLTVFWSPHCPPPIPICGHSPGICTRV